MIGVSISSTPPSSPVTPESAPLSRKHKSGTRLTPRKCGAQSFNLSSRRKRCKRFGEYKRSIHNVFRRRIFVRSMAITVATRDEQHAYRCNARHKKRIMVRPTNHGKGGQSKLSACLQKRLNDGWSALGGGVGVQ